MSTAVPGPAQLPLEVGLRAAPTLANFVAGSNRLAVCALRRLAAAAGAGGCFLWGGAGTGKSHLLEAACTARGAAGGRAMYLPLARLRDVGPVLLEGLGRLDLLCVDDLQAIAGSPGWEEGLFHLYNQIEEAAGALLVAASCPPTAVGLALADLTSRLAASPVYQVRPLADEDRAQALRLRARELGFSLPDEVLRYLLRRRPRDMHGLFELLAYLDRSSLSAKSKLTVPFVRKVLVED